MRGPVSASAASLPPGSSRVPLARVKADTSNSVLLHTAYNDASTLTKPTRPRSKTRVRRAVTEGYDADASGVPFQVTVVNDAVVKKQCARTVDFLLPPSDDEDDSNGAQTATGDFSPVSKTLTVGPKSIAVSVPYAAPTPMPGSRTKSASASLAASSAPAAAASSTAAVGAPARPPSASGGRVSSLTAPTAASRARQQSTTGADSNNGNTTTAVDASDNKRSFLTRSKPSIIPLADKNASSSTTTNLGTTGFVSTSIDSNTARTALPTASSGAASTVTAMTAAMVARQAATAAATERAKSARPARSGWDTSRAPEPAPVFLTLRTAPAAARGDGDDADSAETAGTARPHADTAALIAADKKIAMAKRAAAAAAATAKTAAEAVAVGSRAGPGAARSASAGPARPRTLDADIDDGDDAEGSGRVESGFGVWLNSLLTVSDTTSNTDNASAHSANPFAATTSGAGFALSSPMSSPAPVSARHLTDPGLASALSFGHALLTSPLYTVPAAACDALVDSGALYSDDGHVLCSDDAVAANIASLLACYAPQWLAAVVPCLARAELAGADFIARNAYPRALLDATAPGLRLAQAWVLRPLEFAGVMAQVSDGAHPRNRAVVKRLLRLLLALDVAKRSEMITGQPLLFVPVTTRDGTAVHAKGDAATLGSDAATITGLRSVAAARASNTTDTATVCRAQSSAEAVAHFAALYMTSCDTVTAALNSSTHPAAPQSGVVAALTAAGVALTVEHTALDSFDFTLRSPRAACAELASGIRFAKLAQVLLTRVLRHNASALAAATAAGADPTAVAAASAREAKATAAAADSIAALLRAVVVPADAVNEKQGNVQRALKALAAAFSVLHTATEGEDSDDARIAATAGLGRKGSATTLVRTAVKADFLIEKTPAQAVASGDRAHTLALLWRLVLRWELPLLLREAELAREVNRARFSQRRLKHDQVRFYCRNNHS